MSGQPRERVRLAAVELRQTTDPASLPDPIRDPPSGLIGQDRAVAAIRFGTAMAQPGFNIFVMGDEGSGRHSGTMAHLKTRASSEQPPDDWVYVNNFHTSHKPIALRLPVGTGPRLRDAMRGLVTDLSVALPALFETDDYKAQRGAIDQKVEEAQETAFETVTQAAREKSMVLLRTPVGFAFAPQQDGEIIKPDAFEKLPEETKARIQADINTLQAQLKTALSGIPALEKQRRNQIRELNHKMASGVVQMEVDELRQAFPGLKAVDTYLDTVAEDVVANFQIFLETAAQAQNAAVPVLEGKVSDAPQLRRYMVNVMVGADNGSKGDGAPVVSEINPTYQNLMGRVEYLSQMGTLVTDFTLIKPGALHRANGGYLIVDARQLLLQPGAWDALKRALRAREIRVTSLAEQYSLTSTVSLEPDPIALSLKVILIGERRLYYMLQALDPDFATLFKVQADFDESFARDADAVQAYAHLIDRLAVEEDLLGMSRAAVARVIDEAARDAGDAEKLSLRIGAIADLVREADHWARTGRAKQVDAGHVEQALEARHHRAGRIRERAIEAIARDVVLIDTEGSRIGQVNGLSVLHLGDTRFGKPSRITARVRIGTGKVIDIEREVELGGALHSKGVLILSGFLAARYALNSPISLTASLVFEQSYGGVDGDSASSAELYALLSALADAPLRQDLAVTGSVNQFGDVQAIGGVNEKIEGFYDICRARGLTGTQGVLIPEANIKHLMLRGDVVAACEAGEFHVYPIAHIDEGIESLTGLKAGARSANGAFPQDTINARVEAQLEAYAKTRRSYGRPQEIRGTNSGDEGTGA